MLIKIITVSSRTRMKLSKNNILPTDWQPLLAQGIKAFLNASYGVTICAERNCFSFAINQASSTITPLLVYLQLEKLTPLYFACRQIIAEFHSQDTLIVIG